MTTRLIVVRHGNTFLPTDTPTRVGARTDLDLVEQKKGTAIGEYLRSSKLVPNVIYSGPLKRHVQTAQLICKPLGIDGQSIQFESFLNEIDYGPDENQVEEAVMLRLGQGDMAKGKKAIDDWNQYAKVPDGWLVEPHDLEQGWHAFATNALEKHLGQTVLLVSSNGLMRFSHVLDKQFAFNNLKVPTGGICIFENHTGKRDDWQCSEWGKVPGK